jgi:hypothetical protein
LAFVRLWNGQTEISASDGAAAPNERLLENGLDLVVSRLASAGLKTIILGDVPEIGWSVPQRYARHAWLGAPLSSPPTKAEAEARHASADRALESIADVSGAYLVPLKDLFCNDVCAERGGAALDQSTDNDASALVA